MEKSFLIELRRGDGVLYAERIGIFDWRDRQSNRILGHTDVRSETLYSRN